MTQLPLQEIDDFARVFLQNYNETNAVNFLRCIRTQNKPHIGYYIATHLQNLYPFSLNLKDETALYAFNIGKLDIAYDILDNALKTNVLNEDISSRLLFNQHFSINTVANRYTFYNSNKIQTILNRKKKQFPLVTLTITTCKRYDLFEKTINSILNCFDIENVDEWLLVDDNSSPEDRKKMETLYPFFTFYFKNNTEKGHPQSMNIILNNVKTPYIFHTEDDWVFFCKDNYIAKLTDIINADFRIGQCLINRNYAETESCIDVKGGYFKMTNSGKRYYIHEFYSNEEQKNKFLQKYGGNVKHSAYWPHFSFRPSLIKVNVLKQIGSFNENVNHFERDYAYRYLNQGFISVFLEGIYSLHTGQLTSERTDETKLNAYALNNEPQFEGKEKIITTQKTRNLKFSTCVLNLDRRPDRWEQFQNNAKSVMNILKYERISAIDGLKLKTTPQLQQIFENNDYHMRPGLVGCLLSHISMFITLINSTTLDALLILEDDVEFAPNFNKKFENLIQQLNNIDDWDIVFLGHHVKSLEEQKDELKRDEDIMPTITKRNTYWSFTNSLGGTGGFMITRKGAELFLNYINKTGCVNGIDTLLQKSANELNVYYTSPHLIFTECYRGTNNIDSDIQFDHSSALVRTLEDRFQDELTFYGDTMNIVDEYDIAKRLATMKGNTYRFWYKDNNTSQIKDIYNSSVHPCYTLEDKIIFVIPDGKTVPRYFHRFKKNGKFDISDAISYS